MSEWSVIGQYFLYIGITIINILLLLYEYTNNDVNRYCVKLLLNNIGKYHIIAIYINSVTVIYDGT